MRQLVGAPVAGPKESRLPAGIAKKRKSPVVNAASLKSTEIAVVLALLMAVPCTAEELQCPTVDAEVNAKTLGIAFNPPPARTAGNFVPAVTVGKTMYLAGNGPRKPDGTYVIGKLRPAPGQLSIEQGYEASGTTAINLLIP